MNFCKDCKWYSIIPQNPVRLCKHSSSESVDPVEGTKSYKTCDYMRTTGMCGNAARYWEVKEL